jgi:predicted AlkP superfamily pyrophosphatase or phosphodiesterase
MPARVCVIDLPGLSRELTNFIPADSALGKWLSGKRIGNLRPSFPAVTCSIQATLTTGAPPSKHGMVANGVPTFRSKQDQELVDASNFAEFRRQISFWEQSNQFLDVPRFWEGRYKTALLFFQNSMPGFSGKLRPAADVVLTPKPDHGPDGKLASLCWSQPGDLVPRLFEELGPFPLMNYWGPMAGIAASQWIAKAAAIVWREHLPRLQWTYVPHLDYDLQRFGPNSPQAKQAVVDVAAAVGPLIEQVTGDGGKIVLLSEYAIKEVNAFAQPNRLLAEAGLLTLRQTPDGKLIDFEKSAAVAMVDHQIAHIYVRGKNQLKQVTEALNRPEIDSTAPPSGELRHRRAGDLICAAAPGAWFDYRWWSDPADAPAFAKKIDIHRKPGYDPLELFWDRQANAISQTPALVRGSHGVVTDNEGVWISDTDATSPTSAVEVAGAIGRILDQAT